MLITADYLKEKLEKELETSFLSIEDKSDKCGTKFNCIIVSKVFEGKTLIQCHRLVQDLLKEEYKNIHSLRMSTFTPKQYEQQKDTFKFD